MKKEEKEEEGEKPKEKARIDLSSKYIKLVSRDGKDFFLNKNIACVSRHIKQELKSKFIEGTVGIIKLDIESPVLEKCIDYMHYKYIHQKRAKPEKFIIDPEMGLEILKAAHYLEC